MQPIGHLRSVWKERNGTPRQGLLVPASRASLQLRSDINPVHALDGLQNFSHVWLIYVFHENTNTGRNLKENSSIVKAKVSPPRLNGDRVGLFATRTPHRPNPIGLSAAQIVRIEGDTIHLAGIDLIDGTPVLDIKPYVHGYDNIPHAIVPSWIETPPTIAQVNWTPESIEELESLVPKLEFYNQSEDIRQAIEQVLRLDIRNDQAKRRKQKNYRFTIDKLNVQFLIEEDVATITKVEIDKVLYPDETIEK